MKHRIPNLARFLGIFATLLAGADVIAANQTSGVLSEIDVKKNWIVISSECECSSGRIIQSGFTVNGKTKILLNDKESKLSDLKMDDSIEVEWEKTDEVLKVSATRTP